jgi:hypothetical protein
LYKHKGNIVNIKEGSGEWGVGGCGSTPLTNWEMREKKAGGER